MSSSVLYLQVLLHYCDWETFITSPNWCWMSLIPLDCSAWVGGEEENFWHNWPNFLAFQEGLFICHLLNYLVQNKLSVVSSNAKGPVCSVVRCTNFLFLFAFELYGASIIYVQWNKPCLNAPHSSTLIFNFVSLCSQSMVCPVPI